MIARLAAVVLLLAGCDGRSYNMAGYQRDIERAGKAIEAAQEDAARARAYDARARAYSEKARYGRSFKMIPVDEYERLFSLALVDHERALALAPGDAALLHQKGRTFYDRAALLDASAPERARHFDLAKAEFARALEKDPRRAESYDMRGLVYESEKDYDRAIGDYDKELQLDPPSGRRRLAQAHCERGGENLRRRQEDAAIFDFERSISLVASGDPCECDAYDPLATLYIDRRRYDQAWNLVRDSGRTRTPVAPEIVERLKQASGRTE